MLKNAKRLGMPESKKPIVSEKLLKRLKKSRKKHINLYDLVERQIDYCI